MARTLTRKQRVYVNRKADGATGVAAVLNNYDTTDYNTANAISVENLQKPAIREGLQILGFDTNNAKRVIAEILNDETNEPKDRIKAAENVFKVHGDYSEGEGNKTLVVILTNESAERYGVERTATFPTP